MLLGVHIVIAMASVGAGVAAVAMPSRKKLTVMWCLAGAVVVSGAGLMAEGEARVGQVCGSGLAFLAGTALIARISEMRLRRRIGKIELGS